VEPAESGTVPFAGAMGTKEPSWWEQFVAWWYVRYRLREHFVETLALSNRFVAVADVPLRLQTVAALNADPAVRSTSRDNLLLGFLPPMCKCQDAYLSSRAGLRCTVRAIACERYRLANGRWPASLEELVPRFLDVVPSDPYNDEPLRFTRAGDQVVIESIRS